MKCQNCRKSVWTCHMGHGPIWYKQSQNHAQSRRWGLTVATYTAKMNKADEEWFESSLVSTGNQSDDSFSSPTDPFPFHRRPSIKLVTLLQNKSLTLTCFSDDIILFIVLDWLQSCVMYLMVFGSVGVIREKMLRDWHSVASSDPAKWLVNLICGARFPCGSKTFQM